MLTFTKKMDIFTIEDRVKRELGDNFAIARAIKRPIPVTCVFLNEEFEVETMEGVMKGKKGDVLMIGINGELYPCDLTVFNKTYDIVEE